MKSEIVKTVSKNLNVTITQDELIGLAQLANATKKNSRRLLYSYDGERWIRQLYREAMIGDWEISDEDQKYIGIKS